MLPAVLKLGDIPLETNAEITTTLAVGKRCRLEHILSGANASPVGFWYDPSESEWAIVLRGAADLEFEAGMVRLLAGDAVLIPAHLKHRVARSAPNTAWLALHFEDAGVT